jgi:hypothetical protein
MVAMAALVFPRLTVMSSTMNVDVVTEKLASETASVDPIAGKDEIVRLPALVAVVVGMKSHFKLYSWSEKMTADVLPTVSLIWSFCALELNSLD